MQHGDIWRGLDQLAHANGLSVSGLAKRAGLDATAFNKSKRVSKDGRPRWPSTESLSRALNAVGVGFAEFAALATQTDDGSVPFPETGERVLCTDATLREANWSGLPFPVEDLGDGSFALDVVNGELAAHYPIGTRLIASQTAKTETGDRIIIRLKSGGILLGALGESEADELNLTSLTSPAIETRIDREEIASLARIMWVSQ